MANLNNLSEQEIQQNLLEHYKNFDIKVFDTLSSTNDFAKDLINSNKFQNGTTIIANTQTKGRGRFARTFFSPANTGIYFSTIL
ncbi:MAG: biotin--[Elusimicrobia bacterium]|nr:biotin--[acetyl-CoA-carboxylase] ligase [Elusimicrobiota bacterium]